MVGGYANAISLDLHSITVNGRTDGRQQTAPAIFGRGKDWRPFCLKLCPSGWKQPHCITVTTAAVWELWVHSAAARWQTLSWPRIYSPFIRTNRALCCVQIQISSKRSARFEWHLLIEKALQEHLNYSVIQTFLRVKETSFTAVMIPPRPNWVLSFGHTQTILGSAWGNESTVRAVHRVENVKC